MTVTTQKPKHVNVRLTDGVVKKLKAFRRAYGWTQKDSIELGVQALELLMERHQKTALRASDEDVRELFLRLAHVMPAGLADAKVEEARFADGRPALVWEEDWVIAEDRNGDLMAVRKDGSEIGRPVARGIEVLADGTVALGQIERLSPSPDEVVLN